MDLIAISVPNVAIGLFCTFANSVVFYYAWKGRFLQKAKQIFFCSLVASNALYGVATFLTVVSNVFTEILNLTPETSFNLCLLATIAFFWFGFTYLCSMIAITIEQFVAISRPVWHRNVMNSERLMLRLVFSLWMFLLIFTIILTTNASKYNEWVERQDTICLPFLAVDLLQLWPFDIGLQFIAVVLQAILMAYISSVLHSQNKKRNRTDFAAESNSTRQLMSEQATKKIPPVTSLILTSDQIGSINNSNNETPNRSGSATTPTLVNHDSVTPYGYNHMKTKIENETETNRPKFQKPREESTSNSTAANLTTPAASSVPKQISSKTHITTSAKTTTPQKAHNTNSRLNRQWVMAKRLSAIPIAILLGNFPLPAYELYMGHMAIGTTCIICNFLVFGIRVLKLLVDPILYLGIFPELRRLIKDKVKCKGQSGNGEGDLQNAQRIAGVVVMPTSTTVPNETTA